MAPREPDKGIWIAVCVLALWGAVLAMSLAFAERLPIVGWPLVIAIETFLYTGLFITAHEAMHGSIAPHHSRLNDALGALCTRLYAPFSFRRMRAAHRQHHAHPGTDADPDFARDGRHEFWRWYAHFVTQYFGGWQVLGVTLVLLSLNAVLGVPLRSVLLFWAAPSLLSTFQLFYFGTYLPHREPAGGYDNSHRARSNDFSELASFLSCYHFGYHLEHHEHPHVPWWRLPAVRRARALRAA